MTKNRASGI